MKIVSNMLKPLKEKVIKECNFVKSNPVKSSFIGIPLLAYFLCMFIYPWFSGSWGHVHSVWNNWQSLNTGVLAFISALLLFRMTKHHEREEKIRKRVAYRAHLPAALSELTYYCEESAKMINEASGFITYKPNARNEVQKVNKQPLESQIPDLSKDYIETFTRCMEFDDESVRNYLGFILKKLQIQSSRLKLLHKNCSAGSERIILAINLESDAYDLGELQYLISYMYEYARGEQATFTIPIAHRKDLADVYHNLDIDYELKLKTLIEYTEISIPQLNEELRSL